MPSSTHPAKRPYGGTGSHESNQSTITSYFPSSSRDQPFNAPNSYDSDVARSSIPHLPATVQSNLLSVGMRVRKSVPEGYKTGSHNAFTLFSDATPAVSQPRAYVQGTYHGRRKELAPFCGIMKVGGLAQQGYVEEYEEVFEEDDAPYLSSQGSTMSDASTASSQKNKRRFDGEDEVDDDGEEDVWRQMGEVLQRPRPMSLEVGFGPGSRAMAMPRTRRKGLVGLGAKSRGADVRMNGQENMVTDFEEAEFLDYRWRGEEVDMRDV